MEDYDSEDLDQLDNLISRRRNRNHHDKRSQQSNGLRRRTRQNSGDRQLRASRQKYEEFDDLDLSIDQSSDGIQTR